MIHAWIIQKWPGETDASGSVRRALKIRPLWTVVNEGEEDERVAFLGRVHPNRRGFFGRIRLHV